MRLVVIVLACVAVVAVVAWFFLARKHPENASDLGVHSDGSPRQAKRNDRPAGPSVDDDPSISNEPTQNRPERAFDSAGAERDAGEEGRV